MSADKSPVVIEDAQPLRDNEKSLHSVNINSTSSDSDIPAPAPSGQVEVPLRWKIASILLVSAIGFGSQWSSGVTGAMKTTIKKVSRTVRLEVFYSYCQLGNEDQQHPIRPA
jgi:hypothetical protein